MHVDPYPSRPRPHLPPSLQDQQGDSQFLDVSYVYASSVAFVFMYLNFIIHSFRSTTLYKGEDLR